MARLVLNDLKVSYDGKVNILEDYNLEIEDGKLVSILGPSGCGKTTTLKAVAGFLQSTGGEILIGDEDYSKVPVNKRNFGIVFQSYALFPNMTVFENVSYGLKLRKIPKDEIEKKVLDILETVELIALKDRKPENLSGGQRQRVALARALVISPKLLLLDEPLSNLDAKLRIEMRSQIKRMQQKFNITTILITHDQEECFSISDKVAIMNDGKIEQYDTPENIYSNPKSIFVADFVGFKNLLDVTRISPGVYRLSNGKNIEAEDVENAKKIAIRPQNIAVGQSSDSFIEGTIKVRTYLGEDYQYEVDTDLGEIVVSTSKAIALNTGDIIKLNFPKDGICVLAS
ncbi:ABC transporter ATP-binding protein [Reinekea marinisedimentorum]|uniref:Putative spermidine/putrescine transport system ATP-binding protein n=1 Tax=Reinekea marinisedimentorum TaxID=230495 RepID=A0A4R3HZI3_9GAMM|nr:ABC transporter ATP-binding protein [Reinekea marinisedimentorum]TCS38796.1 putative spermidine/putrescine transport system ATP-binding protein [Reinekea marinisedimentorum]